MEVLREMIGMGLAVTSIVAGVLALRVLMDLAYLNLPPKAKKFVDDNF
jgi:hypothetical protein